MKKRISLIIIALFFSNLCTGQINFEFILSSLNKTKLEFAESLIENGFLEDESHPDSFCKSSYPVCAAYKQHLYTEHELNSLKFKAIALGVEENSLLRGLEIEYAISDSTIYSNLLNTIKLRCKKLDFKRLRNHRLASYSSIYVTTFGSYLYVYSDGKYYFILITDRRSFG